jgi:hypothetical protein
MAVQESSTCSTLRTKTWNKISVAFYILCQVFYVFYVARVCRNWRR